MPKLTFNITQENEEKLRNQNRRKGDMSNIINKALTTYFEKEEGKKQ